MNGELWVTPPEREKSFAGGAAVGAQRLSAVR